MFLGVRMRKNEEREAIKTLPDIHYLKISKYKR